MRRSLDVLEYHQLDADRRRQVDRWLHAELLTGELLVHLEATTEGEVVGTGHKRDEAGTIAMELGEPVLVTTRYAVRTPPPWLAW